MQVHCESDLFRISLFGKLPGSVMLQSRVISEASFTFVSIREFMVLWFYVNRACFQIQGFYSFIFRLRLYLTRFNKI